MKTTVPFIAVITTSAFVGNLLVIGLGFGMYWQSLAPLEFMRQFGVQFPLLLAPTMLLFMPAVITAVIMVRRTKGQVEARKNWWIALLGLLAAGTITSVYHLPVNFGFMDMKYTAAEASSALSMWLVLHWVRAAFVLVAAIFSVRGVRGIG